MKKYKPKSLFSGAVIGKDINTKYCAVPNKYDGSRIEVEYMAQTMIINNWRSAEAFRKFEDKFGRKEGYTLGYFKWKPEGEEHVTTNRTDSSSTDNSSDPVLEQTSLI